MRVQPQCRHILQSTWWEARGKAKVEEEEHQAIERRRANEASIYSWFTRINTFLVQAHHDKLMSITMLNDCGCNYDSMLRDASWKSFLNDNSYLNSLLKVMQHHSYLCSITTGFGKNSQCILVFACIFSSQDHPLSLQIFQKPVRQHGRSSLPFSWCCSV